MSDARPLLTLVIPVGPHDDTALQNLLTSIDRQAFPKDQLEILLCREGNSEEARADGIKRAQGEVIGCLDADNQLLGFEFLRAMVGAATAEGTCGAYPSHYAWFSDDGSLNRYFALLGANDPLAWWLGKADRRSWLVAPRTERVVFGGGIPTLGSNGFFVKRTCVQAHWAAWRTGHIDGCQALADAGHRTYDVLDAVLWHRTGLTLGRYLAKRAGYVRRLYFRQHRTRRWRLVAGPRDWLGVAGFIGASLLVIPHLWVLLLGYRRVRDPAWAWHPVVCLALTCLYGLLTLEAACRGLVNGPGDHRALQLPTPDGSGPVRPKPGGPNGDRL